MTMFRCRSFRGVDLSEIAWLTAMVVVGFAVSYIGASILTLPRAGFVAVHALVSGAVVVAYAKWARVTLGSMFTGWRAGLALGVLAAVFSVEFVLSQPASSGPGGIALAGSLVWLGVAYGTIDALLLTVMPVHAAWRIANRLGWRTSRGGRIAAGIAALGASAAVTAAYHAGFPEFQGVAIVQPLVGNTVFSLVYVLSGNPLGAIGAHIALHVAAILHAYGTSIPLPPHY